MRSPEQRDTFRVNWVNAILSFEPRNAPDISGVRNNYRYLLRGAGNR
jgi:hypothetical protein